MTNGKKLALALLIIEYLANEEMTHHVRRILATIALEILKDSNIAPSGIAHSQDANDIPF